MAIISPGLTPIATKLRATRSTKSPYSAKVIRLPHEVSTIAVLLEKRLQAARTASWRKTPWGLAWSLVRRMGTHSSRWMERSQSSEGHELDNVATIQST